MYRDENGNLVSSHLLKDCEDFRTLQAQYANLIAEQGQVVPGAPAIGAPPPPALPPPGHMAGAIQHQARIEEPRGSEEAYPKPVGCMFMIQKGRPSNRDQKLITR